MPTTLPLPLIIAGAMTTWIETYRGTVYRWELDTVDHFTVAYYFQRFADASLGLLERLELGPAYMAGTGRGLSRWRATCATRELRAGDSSTREWRHRRGFDEYRHRPRVLRYGQRGSVRDRRGANAAHGLGRVPVALSPAQRPGPAPTRWAGTARRGNGVPARRATRVRGGWAGVCQARRDRRVRTERHAPLRSPLLGGQRSRLRGLGMTPAYQRELAAGFLHLRVPAAFPGRLRAGDPALVRGGLLHVGTSSLRVFHRMSNPRTGESVATFDQLGVHLDMDARRPAPLPDALRERARALKVSRPPVTEPGKTI